MKERSRSLEFDFSGFYLPVKKSECGKKEDDDDEEKTRKARLAGDGRRRRRRIGVRMGWKRNTNRFAA